MSKPWDPFTETGTITPGDVLICRADRTADGKLIAGAEYVACSGADPAFFPGGRKYVTVKGADGRTITAHAYRFYIRGPVCPENPNGLPRGAVCVAREVGNPARVEYLAVNSPAGDPAWPMVPDRIAAEWPGVFCLI